jgi:hypothetical protein
MVSELRATRSHGPGQQHGHGDTHPRAGDAPNTQPGFRAFCALNTRKETGAAFLALRPGRGVFGAAMVFAPRPSLQGRAWSSL